MARAVTSVAALVAVVAGVGSGINWMSDHVDEGSVFLTGATTYVALASGWAIASASGVERRYAAYAIATGCGGLVTLFLLADLPADVQGYIYAAVALAPAAIELYLRDQASRRRCPDCCEEIRADANVCKHCAFRFAPKPEIGDVATAGSDQSG